MATPVLARPPVEVGRTAPPSRAPRRRQPAPPGSDPALWSVLTSEERRFFARQAALGPITYGPHRLTPVADAPLAAAST